MGVLQSTSLNTDTNGVATASEYGDRGDGTSAWFTRIQSAVMGAKADAAVTNPATAATQVAILKGLLTLLANSAAGILKSEDAGHTSGDAGVMSLSVRNDAKAAIAGTDLDYMPQTVTANGAVYAAMVAEASSAWALSSAQAMAAASLVIKASAGRLYKLFAQNDNAAARYIQLHNTTSVPADTAVPVWSIKLAIAEGREFDFGPFGRYFSTGICVNNSSTSGTKTIGAADSNFTALYL